MFHNIFKNHDLFNNVSIFISIVFTEHLSEIITNQEIDYSRLQNNIRFRRSRTRFNKEKNAQIIKGQNALTNGDITLEHFLRMFSRFNQHQSDVIFEGKHEQNLYLFLRMSL